VADPLPDDLMHGGHRFSVLHAGEKDGIAGFNTGFDRLMHLHDFLIHQINR
jgi:hypothetical protein